MFASKLSRIIPFQHNLHFIIIKSNSCEIFTHCYSINVKHCKRFHLAKNLRNSFEHLKTICRNNFTNQKRCANLIALWTRQFEFVLAQRIRRGQQMFMLYSKLWEERALKEMLKRMRQQLFRRGKHLLLSGTGLTFCQWNHIKDDDFCKHFGEFDSVRKLTDSQLTCPQCLKRLQIDVIMPDKQYCDCQGLPHTVKERYGDKLKNDEWQPYFERKDTLVWRKEYHPGKYSYKMYGMYSDISANDYLQVQIDNDYRKIWDDSVVQLDIIDTDTDNDVVYWEMKWPRFFSNRDYVFARRHYTDKRTNLIVLISKSIEHPQCPVKKNAIRVTEYWSILVIRPLKNMDQPGLEFSLTYFDDPGVTLPEAMTTWIAITGMPNFITKMRRAARRYKQYLIDKSAPQKVESIDQLQPVTEPLIHISVPVDNDDDDLEEVICYDDDEKQDIPAITNCLPKIDDSIHTEDKINDKKDDYEQIDPLDTDLTKNSNSLNDTTSDSSFWRSG